MFRAPSRSPSPPLQLGTSYGKAPNEMVDDDETEETPIDTRTLLLAMGNGFTELERTFTQGFEVMKQGFEGVNQRFATMIKKLDDLEAQAKKPKVPAPVPEPSTATMPSFVET